MRRPLLTALATAALLLGACGSGSDAPEAADAAAEPTTTEAVADETTTEADETPPADEGPDLSDLAVTTTGSHLFEGLDSEEGDPMISLTAVIENRATDHTARLVQGEIVALDTDGDEVYREEIFIPLLFPSDHMIVGRTDNLPDTIARVEVELTDAEWDPIDESLGRITATPLERTEPGDGTIEFHATVTSTFDEDLHDVEFLIAFHDADGSPVAAISTSVETVPAGGESPLAIALEDAVPEGWTAEALPLYRWLSE